MGRLADGFERALELQPEEAIRWQGPATHREAQIWVGGRIYVSDRRFFFCPGVLSRARHETVRVPLAEIAGVELRKRDGRVSTGGLRRRVVVRTAAGEEHAFSLPRFRKRAGELQALLEGAV